MSIYQTEIPHNTKLYRELEAGTLPAAPVSWDIKRARLDSGFRELESAGFLTCGEDEIQLTRSGLLRVDRLLPVFYEPQFQHSRYT